VNPGEIVWADFPGVVQTKRRPAVVLSSATRIDMPAADCAKTWTEPDWIVSVRARLDMGNSMSVLLSKTVWLGLAFWLAAISGLWMASVFPTDIDSLSLCILCVLCGQIP
jgi:hypothetical protein